MGLLLIFGIRKREKRLGSAADFCHVCHKIAEFDVLEHRMCYHFWFIPLPTGNDRPLGTTQICGSCGLETQCHPGRFAGFRRSSRGSLDALIEATHPSIRDDFQSQLAIADKLASGGEGLDAETRRRLITGAFAMADSHFQAGQSGKGLRYLTLALKPLRPAADEIRAGLQPYRGTMSRMGRALTTDDVMISIYPELEVKDPNKYSY